MRRKRRKKKKLFELIILIVILLVIFLQEYGYVNFKELNQVNFKENDVTPVIETNGNLKVYFIDVGQADSIFITNNNENMLIDAGNNEDGEKLVNYLKSLNINNFKYVVATHAHEDHIGGMDNIINNFSIENFYMPDVVTTTKTFEDVLDSLEAKQLAFQTPQIEDYFYLGSVRFEVLYIGNSEEDLNNTSIVLRATYGSNSFLFMGDATSKIEEKIITKDIKSDVLKVAHHGSQYSSTKAFLNKVMPQYAIISVGRNNTYKHPKKITLTKLEKLNTKIYRTDEVGTIIAMSDGKNISFETMKTDTNG